MNLATSHQHTDSTSSSETAKVVLLGHGNVGGALHQLLVHGRDRIRAATGYDVQVAQVLVRDGARARDIPHRAGDEQPIITTDPTALDFADDEIEVVCEAMGGIEPARTLVLNALRSGCHVVTANKQLVARHGDELAEAALTGGAQLRFEAAACGAVPIVRTLVDGLAPVEVTHIAGILNGTTNYMLSEMEATGAAYGDVLAEAQRLGFAEADPTDDVSGADAAAKLALLATVAFGGRITPDDVPATGIENIEPADIAFAHALGNVIRLLGRASATGAGVTVGVTPVLVPEDHPLAAIRGATNAVEVQGPEIHRLVLQGPGAGGDATASAMAGDLVSVLAGTPRSGALTGFVQQAVHATSGNDEQHYVRLVVPDQTGELARIAGAFSDTGVSIERVIQQRGDEDTATLVLTTHPCSRAAVDAAVATLGDAVVMPILGDSNA